MIYVAGAVEAACISYRGWNSIDQSIVQRAAQRSVEIGYQVILQPAQPVEPAEPVEGSCRRSPSGQFLSHP